jgi:fatty-acyl-CoA synthase
VGDLTIDSIFDAVAAAVPERECVVDSNKRLKFSEFADRVSRLAGFFQREGLGCRTERSLLSPWQSGQDHIGLYMYNCAEYLEVEFASVSSRCAAINLNYRYVDKELAYLAKDAGLRGLIFHSEFAGRVDELRKTQPELKMLIQVQDNSGMDLLPGAIWYEDALEGACVEHLAVTPDDLHILYTGGTTGMPKGVLWRQADVIMAALGGRNPRGMENTVEDFVSCAMKSAGRTLPAGPFMHASGRWTAISQILLGNTVVIPSNTRRLDPDNIWRTVEREQCGGINIAGDAFARPLLQQLSESEYDLSSLRMLSSGAAIMSSSVKRGFMARLPGLIINDTIGASETGPQATNTSADGKVPEGKGAFKLTSSTTILTVGLDSLLGRNDQDIGWLARTGRIPIGYLNDREKTEKTYPTIEGIRYAVPGDRATWSETGEIELIGREASIINSGGEKIFAEEVEMALKNHDSVFDAIVSSRPSERWGEEVVAIVKLLPNVDVVEKDLIESCAPFIARYKLPKHIVFRDEVRRSPSGKPDYTWAKQLVAQNDKLF